MEVNYKVEDVIRIIQKMAKAARDVHGKDILRGKNRVMLLLTGGPGDFSVILKVRSLSFAYLA